MSSFDDADTRFFKGQVGAHVHDWRVDHRWERSETDGEQDYSIYAWCECSSKEGWYLDGDDIERRLNAVEQLSAEDATAASKDSYTATHNPEPRHVAALREYAAALEK